MIVIISISRPYVIPWQDSDFTTDMEAGSCLGDHVITSQGRKYMLMLKLKAESHGALYPGFLINSQNSVLLIKFRCQKPFYSSKIMSRPYGYISKIKFDRRESWGVGNDRYRRLIINDRSDHALDF